MKKINWPFNNKSPKPKAKAKKDLKPPKPQKEPRQISEFEKYLFHRMADKKEYNQRRRKFAQEAAPQLIDACGGIKNIVSAKAINYAVEIQFKNLYQLKQDVIQKIGGLYMRIDGHTLTDIFDFPEAKLIAAIIRRELKASKNKFIRLDLA